MLSDIELREVFHFCFLEHLLKISDPNIYILKGGVNLRFYFKSPRYSEDMDIDVLAGNVSTLTKNGYKILHDDAFIRKLETYGIHNLLINNPAKSKQTETTQRFRLRLVNQLGDEFPTKIEFSRRKDIQSNYSYLTERVDTELGKKYQRLSYLTQHYDAHTAIIQKIQALAGRKEVQARDAFDIFILDIGGHAQGFCSKVISEKILSEAQEALLSIGYADYEGRVLEFLDENDRSAYSGFEIWKEIQDRVMSLIKL